MPKTATELDWHGGHKTKPVFWHAWWECPIFFIYTAWEHCNDFEAILVIYIAAELDSGYWWSLSSLNLNGAVHFWANSCTEGASELRFFLPSPEDASWLKALKQKPVFSSWRFSEPVVEFVFAEGFFQNLTWTGVWSCTLSQALHLKKPPCVFDKLIPLRTFQMTN